MARSITQEVSVARRDPASVQEALNGLLGKMAQSNPDAIVTGVVIFEQGSSGVYFVRVTGEAPATPITPES